mmetsp:Transcript_29915/g.70508  ORF Transcript_29915/g.70508 Transcript_29915/m.70508 type:complete len:110 (-) Transcript_29915:15-344(-)
MAMTMAMVLSSSTTRLLRSPRAFSETVETSTDASFRRGTFGAIPRAGVTDRGKHPVATTKTSEHACNAMQCHAMQCAHGARITNIHSYMHTYIHTGTSIDIIFTYYIIT